MSNGGNGNGDDRLQGGATDPMGPEPEAQEARHEDASRCCAHHYRLPSLLSFS